MDARRPVAPSTLPGSARRQGGYRRGARGMTEPRRVGRRSVPFPHPDKAPFTDPTFTKRDLADYYERVAPVMLPYVRGRPLALQSFPDGIAGKGYFMKSLPKYFPDWIQRVTVTKQGGSLTQVLAADAATL